MTISNEIMRTLRKWKLLSTPQLLSLLNQSNATNPHSFSSALKRLKKRGAVHYLRVNHDHLNFHPLWEKRWKLLEASKGVEKSIALQRTGLRHHLELVELYLHFKREISNLTIVPNITSQKISSVKSFGQRVHAPDLTVKLDGTRELYIEIERTIKSPERYRAKWGAYEGSRQVSKCLYVLEDSEHIYPIQSYTESFFQRSFCRKPFSIAFTTLEGVKESSRSARVSAISVSGTEVIPLSMYLEVDPIGAPLTDQPKNFSPPTNCNSVAFPALRADSSPPTISNEWVCKQTGERSRLEELPKP